MRIKTTVKKFIAKQPGRTCSDCISLSCGVQIIYTLAVNPIANSGSILLKISSDVGQGEQCSKTPPNAAGAYAFTNVSAFFSQMYRMYILCMYRSIHMVGSSYYDACAKK